MRWSHKLIALCLLITTLMSCEAVKPWQRVYLNDHEMQAGQNGARAFEEGVENYREGASGGGSNKTSGGCGCN